MAITIHTIYQTKNRAFTQARKMPKGKPEGILCHSTGANNPDLRRYVDAPAIVGANKNGNHWNVVQPAGQGKMVHAFIGYDKDRKIVVVETLPPDICCFGCGSGSKGSYNYNPAYYQFEICESALTNKEYYDEAMRVAIEYCAIICKKYNIPVKDVVDHAQAHARGYASNHGDISHWQKLYNDNMTKFRQRVTYEIAKLDKPVTPPTTTPKPKEYTLITDVPGYYTAADAQNNLRPVNTVKKGTYFVFREFGGMMNVTKTDGKAGSWINPKDNKVVVQPAPSPTPPPAKPKAGDKVNLKDKTPLYASSTATKASKTIRGDYWLYDGKEVNNRYRITNRANRVNKKPTWLYTTGWIKKSEI